MTRARSWVTLVAIVASGGVTGVQVSNVNSVLRDVRPVTDDMLQEPSPDDWLHWHRTDDGGGTVPLTRSIVATFTNSSSRGRGRWTRAARSSPHRASTTVACNSPVRAASSTRSMWQLATCCGSFVTTRSFRRCAARSGPNRTAGAKCPKMPRQLLSSVAPPGRADYPSLSEHCWLYKRQAAASELSIECHCRRDVAARPTLARLADVSLRRRL